jgi:hypothetical protein
MNDFPEISKEKREKINNDLGETLAQIIKDVDASRKLIIQANLYEEKSKEINISLDFSSYKRLIEYRLLVGLLYIDLLTLVRVYLKAQYKYEELFSLRQINVILTEGLKKIYHFNENNRKKTFWSNDIKLIIENDLPDLKSDYDSLTSKIDEYTSIFMIDKSIKTSRDLSVHYDENPSVVYDMITNLDTKRVYSYMLPFVDLLKDMFDFTNKILKSYSIKDKRESEETEKEFDRKMALVIDFAKKNNFDPKMITKYEKTIEKFKKIKPNI